MSIAHAERNAARIGLKARIASVQHVLILLLAASLAFGVLARPHPENRRFMEALDEMTTFRDGWRRSEVERSLLQHARAQGAVQLAAVQRAAAGKQVPGLQLAKNALPLQPMAALELRSLQDAQQRAQEGSKLTIGTTEPQPLGEALGWRLARLGGEGWTLAAISLASASVSSADVALEHTIATARVDAIAAQQAVDVAQKKLDEAETRFENQRKWKLPWKVLVKTDEARKAARATLGERKLALAQIQQRYEADAKRALEPKPKPAPNAAPIEQLAIAKLELEQGGSPRTLEIPVALTLREVPVPVLRGAEFTAAHAAGLWDELKDLTPDQAIDAIRLHFNWHYTYVELLGVRIGGMTVLQLMPCLLPVLLLLLLLRIRAVSISYNPFGTTLDSGLPRPGFRHRAIECLVLIVLPVAAAALAATSLLLVGQVPALPTLTAVICLILGGYAFSKLGELQALIEAVVRSHSSFPPADPP